MNPNFLQYNFKIGVDLSDNLQILLTVKYDKTSELLDLISLCQFTSKYGFVGILPIITHELTKRNNDFEVKIIGKVWDTRYYATRILLWMCKSMYRRLGEEEYKRIIDVTKIETK